MKKIFYLMAVLPLLVLSSCGKEEGTPEKTPRISISVVNALAPATYPGEVLDIAFDLKYAGGIVEAYGLIDGVKVEQSERTFTVPTDSTRVSFQYMVQDRYAGNTIDFSVRAIGKDDAVGHYDIPVYVYASKPSITITIPGTAPESFEIGTSPLAFNISVTSANVDLKSVTTYKGETKLPDMSFEVTGPDSKNAIIPFSYTPTFADAGSPVTFKFEVMDVNGNIVEAYYSVTFTKPSSSELNEYYGVVMGLNKCTAYGQFFDVVKNKVYKANGVGAHCAEIDLAIFWSGNASTQGVAFASPNVQNVTQIYPEATIVTTLGGTVEDIPVNWAVRNNTIFREVDIDAETYAEISLSAQLREYFDNGEKPANEHVCFKKTAGSVIAFMIHRDDMEADKYGIIRVTARNASNNTGSIVFDYKIEK